MDSSQKLASGEFILQRRTTHKYQFNRSSEAGTCAKLVSKPQYEGVLGKGWIWQWWGRSIDSKARRSRADSPLV